MTQLSTLPLELDVTRCIKGEEYLQLSIHSHTMAQHIQNKLQKLFSVNTIIINEFFSFEDSVFNCVSFEALTGRYYNVVI